jgi:hypothetical protein
MSCFHEVVGLKEHSCAHEADTGGDALAPTEEHGEGDDYAVKAGGGVHVEGAKGSTGMARNLIGHDFEHDSSESVSAWSGTPLGIVEAVLGFGFFDHAAADFEALTPVEIGFK